MAAALAGGVVGGAQAQTITTNSPLSVPVAGNADRLRIVPVLTTIYDSNVLRTNDQRSTGPRDNVRVSPGVSIGLNRLFGRTRFALGGTVGYDFNSRFGQLDRERVNLTARVTTPVGSPCYAIANAAIERSQYDLGDTDVVVGAAYQRQTYDLTLTCDRVADFYPVVGVNYTSLSNSTRAAFDSTQSGVRAGIGFSRPSLGSLELIGSASKIDRPGIEDLTGIDDSTTISDVQLILTRAVAPRVRMRVGAGIAHANPARADVASFTGPAFDAEVTVSPVPRLRITAAAQRAVQNQSSYSATYIVTDTYRVSALYQLSLRSTATLFAQRLYRDPRGQDLFQVIQPRGEDTLRAMGATYAFAFHKSLRLNLSAQHMRRTADNAFYNYVSTSASAGITANF